MALTKEDLQAIREVMREENAHIIGQQEINTRAIVNLENNVIHELQLLNENLPDVIIRHEAVVELEAKVDNHDRRIFVLEQLAANK